MADNAYPVPGITQITGLPGWESLFSALQYDGIYYGVDPTLNSAGRTVNFTTGAAYIRGIYKPVVDVLTASVPAASSQDRVDRLVFRWDRTQTDPAAFIVPTILTGTPGTSTPPALTTVISPTGIYDIPVCRWTSQANGALSGLVDERYWRDGSFMSAARTGGLLKVFPPRLALERDTWDVYRSDGSTWTRVLGSADTGDVNLSAASGWTAAGTLAGRLVNGVVDVELNLTRSGANVSESTATQLTTLPASLRPSRNKYFAIVITGDNAARCDVGTDGGVWLRHAFTAIPKTAEVRATLTYIP